MPAAQFADLLKRKDVVSLEDRYLLVRQLQVLQKAGVPLLASLNALEAQVPSGALQRTLKAISQDLLNGYTLSQAFARYPHSFDPMFIGLIKIGEAGGLLDAVLTRLADLCAWELELRSTIRQALQYPAIVLLTLAGALSIMVAFVLPRFEQLFSSFHTKLPIQTRVILALSHVMTHYGWLAGGAVVIGALAVWGYRRTERGRVWWDHALLRLPVLGPVVLQLGMSRMARAVSALSGSGVPMLETLALAGQSVNNRYIQEGLGGVVDRVKGGEALASALKSEHLFPAIVIQMVATGEEAGHLDELMRHVSDYYDQQVTYLLKKLLTYVEPALLILMGLGVLVMASAVLVPMWDLVKLFKHTGG